jgi:hypothetical protein
MQVVLFIFVAATAQREAGSQLRVEKDRQMGTATPSFKESMSL